MALTCILHFFNTGADLLCWRFAGDEGSFALAVTSVCNPVTYILSPLISLLFSSVVFKDITRKKRPEGVGIAFATCIVLSTAVNIALIIYNFSSGIIYTISAENSFSWGPLSTLPDNLIMISLLCLVPMVFMKGERSLRDRALRCLIYVVLPVTAIIVENFFSVLQLLYPAFAFVLLVVLINDQNEYEKEAIEGKLKLADSRIQILNTQIKSHFIFNSLLAIKELCAEDPKEAENMVDNFAKYLRGNLEAMDTEHMIPFTKELGHIKSYLELEQADPASMLNVVYDLKITDFMIPPLSVQPMVENAVRHGIGTRAGGGTVTISTEENDREILVTVRDDGVGNSSITEQQKKRASIGIKNVRERLEALCSGSLEIIMESDGTTAVIRIPKGRRV